MTTNKSAGEYNNEEQVPRVLVAVNATAAKKQNKRHLHQWQNESTTNESARDNIAPANGKTNLHNFRRAK